MTTIAGLDVGGAHLKIALVDNGTPVLIEQYACPLWQGIGKLDVALAAARPHLDRADHIAITMTGELSDLFDNRRQGVAELAEWLAWELGDNVRFWMGARGFGTCDCAIEHHGDVGSTNFLATAEVVAQTSPTALLVDFGSTTADIIPIVAGRPLPIGLCDAVRQTTGELVYTGYTRTAVMGVSDRAPFKGEWVGLAREHLANMADVRRILGELDPDADLHATADGRGKSLTESTQRLARMLGRDAEDGIAADWQITARAIADQQMRTIHDGILRVLSRHPELLGARLVTAGTGTDVITSLALRLAMQPISFGAVAGLDGKLALNATRAAPATAVALLYARNASAATIVANCHSSAVNGAPGAQ